jgi:hypothetical protein
MAKKTASDLQLKQEEVEGPKSMEEVPDEFSASPPPPYPGAYRFRLPANLTALWDKFMTKIRDTDTQEVERVTLIFDKEDPLTIIQAPPTEQQEVGTAFTTRLNNRERNRARKNETPLFVADLLYLLRALGETAVPKFNIDYINLMNKYGGREFGADLEWTTNCNEENQIYIEEVDQATGAITLVPGVDGATGQPVKGCGARYYMNHWPRDPQNGNRYRSRLICGGKNGVPCGASLRPFGQLRNFRA